jgi:hypothetical protein
MAFCGATTQPPFITSIQHDMIMDRLHLIKMIVHRRAREREPPSPVDIVGTFDQEQESFNIKELFSWRGYIETAETGI